MQLNQKNRLTHLRTQHLLTLTLLTLSLFLSLGQRSPLGIYLDMELQLVVMFLPLPLFPTWLLTLLLLKKLVF